MDDLSYAWKVLSLHTTHLNKISKWRGLELGPGDSVLSALIAPGLGSTGLVLVDVGEYIDKDIKRYNEQITRFKIKYNNLVLPNYSQADNLNKMLKISGGEYYHNGIQSLKKLKSGSFDLIYSQAVLEHIRLDEFVITMIECKRLLKSGGVMSHVIDFKDHIGGGLNNLRFSDTIWEKDWFAFESGFYTNRLRLSEVINICKRIGFEVRINKINKWDSLPIKYKYLDNRFRKFTNDELIISGAHLIMNI